VGLGASRWHLPLLAPPVHDRAAADEAPDVRVEAAELLLEREKAAGVRDRRLDLLAVADDAGIAHQPLDRPRVEACDALRIEVRKRAAIAFALAQDRPPAEPGLGALEQQELEVPPVVADRHAPFDVVVA